MRLIIQIVLIVVAMSCQTYDFEKVTPLALAQTTQTRDIVGRNFKPNVMMLVDRSGSMNFPINTACGTTCGTCGANCPTRISELRSAMQIFTSSAGKTARFGLALFPKPEGDVCTATTDVKESLLPPTATDDNTEVALQNKANVINMAIQDISPRGGTPTAASLKAVGDLAGLNDATDNRKDFVLLLTDGLPNCNAGNKNTCQSPNNACACTSDPMVCMNSCTTSQCLDKDATVEQIEALKRKGIQTIVVGFGSDFSGGGLETLNAMANAGGFPRGCPKGTDAECGAASGSNSCNVTDKLCNIKFYKASNGTELAAELAKISDGIGGDLCVFSLDSQPSDRRQLIVDVNGANVSPGPDTWNYTQGTVTFVGKGCADIKASTSVKPVKVSIRVIEVF
jgi:hypothetical protein